MKNSKKYMRQYFPIEKPTLNWVNKEYIEAAPIWCSVDLRDGNQSLVVPMTLEEKLEFFKHLIQVGFKEIEIGFPASSETEYAFCRKLIEDRLIPDDVTIQVLTQARDHIIKKTFEALGGVKNAIVHVYNSTSVAQREQCFKKSKQEIIEIAVESAKLIKHLATKQKGKIRFAYSPESFTGTEPEYAVEVCNAVLDIWKPTAEKKVVINLPATVQHSLPHIYANQIEYVCQNIKYRKNVIISLHPHNDRGTATADCELGLLAGADRVEGTLFGNGERTGNADIITVALNMYAHGIDPNLDFSEMPKNVSVYEKVTRMKVHERSPYAGALVFCAFSGSHQDAIAKGMKHRIDENCPHWTVPYLPIDPNDIGRSYEYDVIRINSQSGKGGVGYILEQNGYNLPPKMREAVGYSMKHASDKHNRELSQKDVIDRFIKKFVDISVPIKFIKCDFINEGTKYTATLEIKYCDKDIILSASGNGRLDAASKAVTSHFGIDYSDLAYSQHTLGTGSDSKACSYIGLNVDDTYYWGVGVDTDITTSSIKSFISATNKIMKKRGISINICKR